MREAGDRTAARWHSVLFVLVALAVILMPFPLLVAGALSPDGVERALLLLNDVPLLALAVVTLPGLVGALRRGSVGAGVALAVAIAAGVTVSFADPQSLAGVQVVGRVIGLLGLAAAIAALPPRFTRS